MDYLTYFLPIILMLVVLYFRIWGELQLKINYKNLQKPIRTS